MVYHLLYLRIWQHFHKHYPPTVTEEKIKLCVGFKSLPLLSALRKVPQTFQGDKDDNIVPENTNPKCSYI